MIDLPNKDGLIFDLPQRIADIIKEYQSTGALVINTNNEGISLQAFFFTFSYGIEYKLVVNLYDGAGCFGIGL